MVRVRVVLVGSYFPKLAKEVLCCVLSTAVPVVSSQLRSGRQYFFQIWLGDFGGLIDSWERLAEKVRLPVPKAIHKWGLTFMVRTRCRFSNTGGDNRRTLRKAREPIFNIGSQKSITLLVEEEREAICYLRVRE
jgi:hypothetical protein